MVCPWHPISFTAPKRRTVRSTAFAACFDLSVPALALDIPQPIAPDRWLLTVRTVSGAPLDSNRLAGMEVRSSASTAQPLIQWITLTNRLVLSNGVARIDDIDSGAQPQQFFIVNEPN